MKAKNRVIKRGCFVPGEEECCLGKRKVSPGRPQWSELEKRPVLPQSNTMQVPQQLLYFLTREIHRSTANSTHAACVHRLLDMKKKKQMLVVL